MPFPPTLPSFFLSSSLLLKRPASLYKPVFCLVRFLSSLSSSSLLRTHCLARPLPMEGGASIFQERGISLAPLPPPPLVIHAQRGCLGLDSGEQGVLGRDGAPPHAISYNKQWGGPSVGGTAAPRARPTTQLPTPSPLSVFPTRAAAAALPYMAHTLSSQMVSHTTRTGTLPLLLLLLLSLVNQSSYPWMDDTRGWAHDLVSSRSEEDTTHTTPHQITTPRQAPMPDGRLA